MSQPWFSATISSGNVKRLIACYAYEDPIDEYLSALRRGDVSRASWFAANFHVTLDEVRRAHRRDRYLDDLKQFERPLSRPPRFDSLEGATLDTVTDTPLHQCRAHRELETWSAAPLAWIESNCALLCYPGAARCPVDTIVGLDTATGGLTPINCLIVEYAGVDPFSDVVAAVGRGDMATARWGARLFLTATHGPTKEQMLDAGATVRQLLVAHRADDGCWLADALRLWPAVDLERLAVLACGVGSLDALQHLVSATANGAREQQIITLLGAACEANAVPLMKWLTKKLQPTPVNIRAVEMHLMRACCRGGSTAALVWLARRFQVDLNNRQKRAWSLLVTLCKSPRRNTAMAKWIVQKSHLSRSNIGENGARALADATSCLAQYDGFRIYIMQDLLGRDNKTPRQLGWW